MGVWSWSVFGVPWDASETRLEGGDGQLEENAAPAGLVDGFALGEPVLFEVGLRVREGVGEPGEVFEGGAGGEVFEGVLEVFFVIGLEQELAGAGCEDAFETGEEFLAVDEAVFVMAFLGPGIRAEQVEAGDASGGQKPSDGVGAFEA